MLALAAVAGFAYLIDLPTAYQWGYATGMAVHTAAGLTMLGMGIIAYAWGQYRSRVIGTFRWVPGVVGLGVLVIILALWRVLMMHEHTLIERKVTIAKAELISQITQEIAASIQPLVRLARRWEIVGAPRQDEWETDATLYVRAPWSASNCLGRCNIHSALGRPSRPAMKRCRDKTFWLKPRNASSWSISRATMKSRPHTPLMWPPVTKASMSMCPFSRLV